MEQPELTNTGWPSEEEIAALQEQQQAEAEAQQQAPAAVDTETGEVQEGAADPAPETTTAVAVQAVATQPRPQPMTHLMTRQPAPAQTLETFKVDMQIAGVLAQSGVFPNARDAKRAYAAILIGRDLGMGPAEALISVEFGAQGKPMISVHWQAAQIRRNGHDYRVVTLDGSQCMIHFYRRYNGNLQGLVVAGRIGMTASDAKKIPVYDKEQKQGGQQSTLGNKWNYRAWSEDMLYAYCMRRGVRRFYPELLMGYGGTVDEEQEGHEAHGAQDGVAVDPDTVQENIATLYGGDPVDVSGR